MKREKYIDISRAIAMILVVMVHCCNETSFEIVGKFSGLFFIPLFIFISGYFSKENDIKTIKELFLYLKKKILRLYVFYVSWELIYFALTNVFFKIGFYSSVVEYGDKIITPINSLSMVFKKIIEIVLLMGREPFCGAFWFIITLMFIIIGMGIINYCINNIFKKKKESTKQFMIGIIVFICYIIGCIMSKTINIPRVSPTFTLVIFYYFGFLVHRYKEKIKFNNVFLAIISLTVLLFLCNKGVVALNGNIFPDGVFLMISSISGIYFVMFVSILITKLNKVANVFSYIGKNTLSILALHFISFKLVMILQYKLNFIKYEDIARLTGWNNGNAFYILYVIVGIGIPLLLGYVYDKIKVLIVKKR